MLSFKSGKFSTPFIMLLTALLIVQLSTVSKLLPLMKQQLTSELLSLLS